MWVRALLQSLKNSDITPVPSKEFLDIQATIEYGFTVKRVRDMTRTYSLAWVLIHMLCLSFCSFTCNIPCTVLYFWSTFIFLHIYSHIHTHRLIILVQLTTLSLGIGHLLSSSSRILQDLVKFYLRRCSWIQLVAGGISLMGFPFFEKMWSLSWSNVSPAPFGWKTRTKYLSGCWNEKSPVSFSPKYSR